MTPPDTAVIDVDGTLVDTNYHHALAWFRAFRRLGRTIPVWQLHRAVGMGGDQLVPAVAGETFDAEHGDDARAAWKEEFAPLLPEIQPLAGAHELLADLSGRFGSRLVLASSGAPEHVRAYLDLFDGLDGELRDRYLTRDDVDRTKPEPDLIDVAVRRVGGTAAFVVGDSVWDVRAACAAGRPVYAVRTGGFCEADLRAAGAREVFAGLAELRGAPADPARLAVGGNAVVQIVVERPRDRIVLIRANGVCDRAAALDLLNLVDLHADLAATEAPRHRCLGAVLVDLDGVTWFEPGALRILRHARRRADRTGFTFGLCGCGGRVHLLPLTVQRVLAEFRTFPSADAAVAALGGSRRAGLRPLLHPAPACRTCPGGCGTPARGTATGQVPAPRTGEGTCGDTRHRGTAVP